MDIFSVTQCAGAVSACGWGYPLKEETGPKNMTHLENVRRLSVWQDPAGHSDTRSATVFMV